MPYWGLLAGIRWVFQAEMGSGEGGGEAFGRRYEIRGRQPRTREQSPEAQTEKLGGQDISSRLEP